MNKITFSEAYPLMHKNFSSAESPEDLFFLKKHHTRLILKHLSEEYFIELKEADLSAPYPIAPEKLNMLKDADNENEIIHAVNSIISAMSGLGEGSKSYHENKKFDFDFTTGDEYEDKRRTLAYLKMNKALALGNYDADETLQKMPEPIETGLNETLTSGIPKTITSAMKMGINVATPIVIKAISAYVANCSQSFPLPPFGKSADGHMIVVNETPYEFKFIANSEKHGKSTTLTDNIAAAVISEPWDDDDPVGVQIYASAVLIEVSKADSALIGVEAGTSFECKKENIQIAFGMSVPLLSGNNKGIVILGQDASAELAAEIVDKDGSDSSRVYEGSKVNAELKVSSGSGGTPRYIVRLYVPN